MHFSLPHADRMLTSVFAPGNGDQSNSNIVNTRRPVLITNYRHERAPNALGAARLESNSRASLPGFNALVNFFRTSSLAFQKLEDLGKVNCWRKISELAPGHEGCTLIYIY